MPETETIGLHYFTLQSKLLIYFNILNHLFGGLEYRCICSQKELVHIILKVII